MKRKHEELENDPDEVKQIVDNPESVLEVKGQEQMGAEEIKIKISTTTLTQLLESYNATCGHDDLEIFYMLRKKYRKELDVLPMFGPKCTEKLSKLSNPLLAHSSRANIILSSVNDSQAFTTALQYSEGKMKNAPNPGGFYDLRFLLPLVCHALDEKNICDVLKVIQNGWVYVIMRGLSLPDDKLRNAAFLAFKRLIFGLQQPKLAKNQDVKIWLHVLQAVRRGIQLLGECKLSHLMTTWLVATWEVLKQPSHLMYNRLTMFLLARPVLEMAIIPEFIPFYNASDGNKESREWILNVLYWGLNDNEDWKIAQKLPVVKFLCSSFLLEKLKTKKNIVGILSRGAKLPEVADLFIDKYSLPLWIAGIVTRDSFLQSQLSKLLTSLQCSCTRKSNLATLFAFVGRKMEINNLLAASTIASHPDELEENEVAEQAELNGNG